MSGRIPRTVRGYAAAVTVGLFAWMSMAATANAGLATDRDALQFGSVRAGDAAYIGFYAFAIDEQTTVESLELTDPAGPFSIDGEDCSGDTLDIGEVCVIGIVFEAPDADASYQTAIVIAPVGGDSLTVPVLASSHRAGDVTSQPAALTFNRVPRTLSVSLMNRRADLAKVTSATASPGFAITQNRCTNIWSPGSTCRISIRAEVVGATGSLQLGVSSALWEPGGSITSIPPFTTLSVPLNAPVPVRRVRLPLPSPASGKVDASLIRLIRGIRGRIKGGPARLVTLPRFTAPTAGRLSFTIDVLTRKGKRIRAAASTADLKVAEARKLGFRLSRRARQILRHPQTTRIRVVASFLPNGAGKGFVQARRLGVGPPAR